MSRFYLLFIVAVLSFFFLGGGSRIAFDPIFKEKTEKSMKQAVQQCHDFNTKVNTKTHTTHTCTTGDEHLRVRGLLVKSVLGLVETYTTYSFKISDLHSTIILEFLYRTDKTSETIRHVIRILFENLIPDFRFRFIIKLPGFLRLKLHPIPVMHVSANGNQDMIDKFKIYINNLYSLVANQFDPEADNNHINDALEVIAASILTTDFIEEMMDMLKIILSSKSLVLQMFESDSSTQFLVQFLYDPKTKTFLDIKDYFLNIFINVDIVSDLSLKSIDSSSNYNHARIVAALETFGNAPFISYLTSLPQTTLKFVENITVFHEKYFLAVEKMRNISLFQSQTEFKFTGQSTEQLDKTYDAFKAVKTHKTALQKHHPNDYKVFYKTIGKMLIHFLTKLKKSPDFFRKKCFLEFKIIVLFYDISDYESSGEESCIFSIIEMFNITAGRNVMSESDREDLSSTFKTVYQMIHDAFRSKYNFSPNSDNIFQVFEFLKHWGDSVSKRCFELTDVYIRANPNIEDVIYIWKEMEMGGAVIFDPNIFVGIFFMHLQQNPKDINFMKQFANFLIEERVVPSSQGLILQNYFTSK